MESSSSASSSYKVEQLPGPVCQLGEGPIWDVETQSLYYVDVLGAVIIRYDYKENATYRATIDGLAPISFIFPVEGRSGEFVLGTGTDLSLVSWDGKSRKAIFLRTVASLVPEGVKLVRFNDGKVDRFGRLYTGTMLMEGHGDVFEQKDCKFYRFDGKFGGTFVQQKDGIGISNGITWDEKSGVLYYVDSCAFDVKQFQVNAVGDLENEQVLIDISNNGKNPGFVGDGMTNDTEGNLYLATWCGSKVLKIDVKKRSVVQEIGLPVTQVTSVAFGGPDLDELFVTSAATDVFDGTEGFVNLRPAGSGKVLRISG